MKANPNEGNGEASLHSLQEYLATPEPQLETFAARNRFNADDDEPGIPSGFLERSSETRRSPVPRNRRAG